VFDGFTPTGGSALIFAPAVCDVPFVGSTALSGIALDFTSFSESCEVIHETALCGNKASSTRILAVVLGGEVGADSVVTLGPGTYPYLADPPTGSFKVATAQAVQDDDACEPLSDETNLDMTGGSVTITSVAETTVSGSTSIRFENGHVFEHEFSLTTCLRARIQSLHLRRRPRSVRPLPALHEPRLRAVKRVPYWMLGL
jgi:hypothetical protein